MNQVELRHGDCLDVLATLEDNSIDSIVTDPPYGLSDHSPADVVDCLTAWMAGKPYLTKRKGFMGKTWDSWVPGPEVWRECFRVLKPGGYLLCFASTRTTDLMSMAIRLAGFRKHPEIYWVFGSGFPKAANLGKRIDKINAESDRKQKFTQWMRSTGLTASQVDAATGTFMGKHYLTSKSQPQIPTPKTWAILRPLCGDIPAWVDELVDRVEAERAVTGEHKAPAKSIYDGKDLPTTVPITAPATPEAQQWDGWYYGLQSLKPAVEPILMFQKPADRPMTENVLAWGTGAINVDGCRVGTDEELGRPQGTMPQPMDWGNKSKNGEVFTTQGNPSGRWPANLMLSDDPEVTGMFPVSDSARASGNPNNPKRGGNHIATSYGQGDETPTSDYRDSGSAARFFYQSKASGDDRWFFCRDCQDAFPKKEQDGHGHDHTDEHGKQTWLHVAAHPTVKPTDLMRYLVRLVTPPAGTLLDPFCGSGSTLKAAVLEGFNCIGIDVDAEYLEIARRRAIVPAQLPLFTE